MRTRETRSTVDAFIVALPDSAGSALYGMVDVLAATGTLWRELTGAEPGVPLIRPRLASTTREPFTCGNGIPIRPEVAFNDVARPEVVIVPELWLAPNDTLQGRYGQVKEWLRACHADGATIYSACSGSVLLAASGLLDGRDATSHWGYEDLFRRSFPAVRFHPAPSLCMADPAGRIVTAGGTSSWHDLAIHIISRHASPGEALHIAKVYLLKWHAEGQLPYASLVRRLPHADSAVRQAETWLAEHFAEADPVAGVVAACGVPERSLKRRFKTATGSTLIEYAQSLRVESAKRLLETGESPADEVAASVGYENAAFFRRLFKRSTGLTPGDYRRMFRPFAMAG
jgi:transcriptional regulator GlxA family with amidase domain